MEDNLDTSNQGQQKEVELTLLMPCLNEFETIGTCVRIAVSALKEKGISGEVLVADNGSTDNSKEEARQAGARVIDAPLKGYGGAIRAGIDAAHGKYIVMGDADNSYDWSDITKFHDKLSKGFELVMGCRLPSGGGTIEKGAMPFLHRWLGNPVLSLIGRFLFRSSITDFHCGMRGFHRQKILQLNLVTTGMEFASEMIIKSEFSNLKIAEVPITLRPDERSRAPHLRTWHDGWRHLRFMLLHSPKWVFIAPGASALGIGLLGFASLLSSSTAITQLTLLACALLTLSGLQWIIFGLSARIFGMNQGLLPKDQMLTSLFKTIKLETGCVLGGLIFLAGLITLPFALSASEANQVRVAIPSMTLTALGIQIVLSSFFLSMLGLDFTKKKPH